jgi:hypothetical protein
MPPRDDPDVVCRFVCFFALQGPSRGFSRGRARLASLSAASHQSDGADLTFLPSFLPSFALREGIGSYCTATAVVCTHARVAATASRANERTNERTNELESRVILACSYLAAGDGIFSRRRSLSWIFDGG